MRSMKVAVLAAAAMNLVLLALAGPPMVSGDVPVPDAGTVESYVGLIFTKNGGIDRELPFVELVYGVTDRWELSLEDSLVSTGGEHGPGDVAAGTKFVLLPENDNRPGVALRYEHKFDNGDAAKGLGSGGTEDMFRLHVQKSFAWFTPIVNVGYIFVPDADVGPATEPHRDVCLVNFAQTWRIAPELKLLSEVCWKTSDSAGGDYRLAWNVGFKYRLSESLCLQGAGGSSLRPHHEGGPDLRIYCGIEYDFAVLP